MVLTVVVCLATVPADAQVTSYWNGAASGAWGTAGNWSAGVPGAADTAVFSLAGSNAAVTVSLGANRTVTGLDIPSSGGLTAINNNTLTASSTLSGRGALVLKNTFTPAMLPNNHTKTGGITLKSQDTVGQIAGAHDWKPTVGNMFGNNPLTILSGRIWPVGTFDVYVREIICPTAYTSWEGNNRGGGNVLRLTACSVTIPSWCGRSSTSRWNV